MQSLAEKLQREFADELHNPTPPEPLSPVADELARDGLRVFAGLDEDNTKEADHE